MGGMGWKKTLHLSLIGIFLALGAFFFTIGKNSNIGVVFLVIVFLLIIFKNQFYDLIS